MHSYCYTIRQPAGGIVPKKTSEVAIGQRIVAWRHRQGLSQARLCRRAGFSPSYLSRLETGKVQPNLRTLQRIVAALRIDVSELLGPSPPQRKDRPCPVSRGGQCLMDIIDANAEHGAADGPERYSPRQLRLIRRFTTLVGQNERSVLPALELLVGKMLNDGSR